MEVQDTAVMYVRRLLGIAAFALFGSLLEAMGQSLVPPMLLGMLLLFVALLALERLHSVDAANLAYWALEPGYRFLMKWAPVFFIPTLVRLPLEVEMETSFTAFELFRIALLLVVGAIFQLSFVSRVASLFPRLPAQEALPTANTAGRESGHEAYPRPGRPYKRRWMPAYLVVMAVACIVARQGLLMDAAEVVFMLSAGLLGFVFGTSLPAIVKLLLHPFFVGVLGSWAAVALWAAQAGPGVGFWDILENYNAGAGPVLSRLLGPLIISLALLLFEHRDLLRRDLKAILVTTSAAALMGMFGTAVLSRLLFVPAIIRAAALTRYCTVALALPTAASLGASQPLAVVMLVLSGFSSVFVARPVLHVLAMKQPRERGLPLGALAHVLGTVTLAAWGEASAVPYGALAFVLGSGFTALFAAVPIVHWALLWIVS